MHIHKNGPIVFIVTQNAPSIANRICTSSVVLLKPFFTDSTLSLSTTTRFGFSPLLSLTSSSFSHRGNEWRNCKGHGGFERRCWSSPQRSTRITGVISHCQYWSAHCCCPTSLCGVRISLPTLSLPLLIFVCTWHIRTYTLYIVYAVGINYTYNKCFLNVQLLDMSPPPCLPGAQLASLSMATTLEKQPWHKTHKVKLEPLMEQKLLYNV